MTRALANCTLRRDGREVARAADNYSRELLLRFYLPNVLMQPHGSLRGFPSPASLRGSPLTITIDQEK
jgi:hypothetical protein